MKSLQQTILEAQGGTGMNKLGAVNEADISSKSEFIEYGKKVLKNAHGEDYDEEKAEDTLNGILDDSGEDYGEAVGKLQSSLGESFNEALLNEAGKNLSFTVDDEDVKGLKNAFKKANLDWDFESFDNEFWIDAKHVDKARAIIKDEGAIIFDEKLD